MAPPSYGRILSHPQDHLTALASSFVFFRERTMLSHPTVEEKPTMTRRESNEYQARVTDDAGILRGKIPSPLVRELGARAGDYIVFRRDNAGRVTVSLARAGRSAAAKGASRGRAAKKGGKKSAARR